LHEDWPDPDDEVILIAVPETLTRKASIASSVEARKWSKGHSTKVGWAVGARGAPRPRASLETADSGGDRLTRRLSSVRRRKFGWK